MNIRRRDALCFALGLCSAPLRAQGQQAGKVYRIAWLTNMSMAGSQPWKEFVGGMRELGWIEGQNFTIENLYFEGRSERLPALAAEAVQRKVDLIMCASSSGSKPEPTGRPPRTRPRRSRSSSTLSATNRGKSVPEGARVAKLAIEQRLPAMIVFEEVARDGVLMSYGPKIIDEFRRLPRHVDRILKGAKPADLPLEQPTRFYLTINLKTAKALGITIPQSLLLRADEVIQ